MNGAVWLFLLSNASEPTSGAPSALGVEVVVHCAELDEEASAAIQARQMGELLAMGQTEGALRLGCASSTVFGSWKAGEADQVSLTLAREANESLSESLLRLAALITQIAQTRAQAQQDQDPAPPALADSQAAPIAEQELSVRTDQVEIAVPIETLPIEQPQTSTQIAPTPNAASSSTSTWSRRSSAPSGALQVQGGGAMRFDYFGGEAIGALGPQLFMEIFRGSFGVGSSMSYLSGIQRVEGFLVREWEAGLYASASAAPWLNFNLGPIYSVLDVDSEASVSAEKTRSISWGFAGMAQFVYGTGDVTFTATGGLKLLATERRVFLDENELFSISPLQGSIRLGVRFEL